MRNQAVKDLTGVWQDPKTKMKVEVTWDRATKRWKLDNKIQLFPMSFEPEDAEYWFKAHGYVRVSTDVPTKTIKPTTKTAPTQRKRR